MRAGQPTRRRWRFLALLAACTAAAPAARAAAPPAGTVIVSQAQVRYVDSLSNRAATLDSNIVRVIVQPQQAVVLGGTLQLRRAAGTYAVWSQDITNTGNVGTVYALSLANDSGDDFQLDGLRIVHDLNGNGVDDPGEPDVTSIDLAAGEIAGLLVIGRLPASAGTAQRARVVLRAAAAGGSAAAAQVSTVQATQGAVLTLAQTASTQSAARDQVVTLDLVASNSGSDAEGVNVTVDGRPEEEVLLTFPLPQGTELVDADHASQDTLLYHLAGTPARRFSTRAPVDLSQVDQVALALDAFAAGRSVRLVMRVKVTASSGWLTSTALASFGDPGGEVTTPSNRVAIRVVATASSLRYYSTSAFSQTAHAAALGANLHLRASAAACNGDASSRDVLTIEIRSDRSGDQESFSATETGPDTGVFETTLDIPTQDMETHPAATGDGVLQSAADDTLVAEIRGCGTDAPPAELFIDPAGTVFDSRSNEPLAGATVQLIDVTGGGNGGAAGGAARVFALDGFTPLPSELVTGPDGTYQFPLVAPSTYRLRVTPPPTHIFPSKVPAGALPAGRTIDLAGSYGGNFVITADSDPVRIDLPADGAAQAGLLLQKTATRTTAEIGDFVDYQLRVRNTSGVTLQAVAIADTLPAGFAYQRGSARRDGQATVDPAGGRGPVLHFELGPLADAALVQLSYRVRIEATARPGDALNRAQASSGAPVARQSNVAQHKLRVEGGVFGDQGFIVGKVWADCNGSGLQEAGEPGIPSVRVWLEDGSYALTDGAGKFSFYGLSPRTHVAKLDRATLPAGVRAAALDARQAGDGDTRFVDMKNGELMRADFALGPCSDELVRQVRQRRLRLDGRTAAAAGPSDTDAPLSLDPAPADDPRARPASGIVAPAIASPFGAAPASTLMPSFAPAADPLATAMPSLPATAAPSQVQPARRSASPQPSLQALAERVTPGQPAPPPGLLEPRDGAVVGGRQTRVRTVSRLGAQLTVLVNGQPVADSRLGSRIEDPVNQIEWREYIGIELQPGANRLELEQRDAFGNLRAHSGLTLQASGELAQVRLQTAPATTPRAEQPEAGGAQSVTVLLEDELGLPVAGRIPVTLNSDLGTWLTADLNPAEPGTQVFVEDGRASFVLAAADHPGTAHVSATAGVLHADTAVSFTAALREMVAVGVVEGVLNLRRLGGSAVQPAGAADGFERELRAWTSGEDRRASARAAVFLKGKVRGNYLLTLGYDSDKDSSERLFRDIQPDRFYPVYGDASVKGFDAQSTARLYVRVDKDRSWLLLGDFNTAPGAAASAAPARKLGVYSRSLNGLRHHVETERLTLDAFASRDRSRQVVEELPANGTSGPYLLGNRELGLNSETVEILTRDRNQSALVIRRVPQARFADYEIEPYTGRLLFKGPVPSLDADFNPVSIRVTYEVDQGGRAFWVSGVDLQYGLTDELSIGAIEVEERNPQDGGSLRGLSLDWQPRKGTRVAAELARSSRDSSGSGGAQRVELSHDDGDLQLRAYAGRAQVGFDNPGSLLSRGRGEAAAKMSYTLSERTRLVGEAIHTASTVSSEHRTGVLLGVEHGLGDNLKLELGLRRVQAQDAARGLAGAQEDGERSEETSLRAKLSAPVPQVAGATVYGEVEQAVGDSAHRMAALGGEYRLSDRTRLYGRHEFISSLTGPYDLGGSQQRNATVLGLDGAYDERTRAFSEYRARDAFDGRQAEAAMGLKNQWQVADGVRVNTSLERVHALSQGARRDSATAVTGALEWTTSPRWKASGRLEWRTAPGSENLLASTGLALKLDEEWTALARAIVNVVRARLSSLALAVPGDRLQQRTQLGLAWRDAETNVFSGLGRYEWKTEDDDTPGAAFARQVHVVSLHGNAQPSRALVVSARYAAKLARDRSLGLNSRSLTQLLAARALYDLDERWDAGVQASTLFTRDGAARRGLGGEVGLRVQANLWVSAGYNILGWRDVDLAQDDHTERGAYLRLRFKFDEKLWQGGPP